MIYIIVHNVGVSIGQQTCAIRLIAPKMAPRRRIRRTVPHYAGVAYPDHTATT